MINETLLVQQYLNGQNINKDILYRICYLLTKWYKEHGNTDLLSIRKSIFNWANKYKLYLDFDLTNCIVRAYEDSSKLTSDNLIKISKSDIKEITDRFDSKNLRLIALGLLCYAKQFANKDREFDMSVSAFCDWIGIARNNFYNRYLNIIYDFKYITKINEENVLSMGWLGRTKKISSKMNRYRINVKCTNHGSIILDENNIRELYNRCFESV